jgi:hypothetical protein
MEDAGGSDDSAPWFFGETFVTDAVIASAALNIVRASARRSALGPSADMQSIRPA